MNYSLFLKFVATILLFSLIGDDLHLSNLFYGAATAASVVIETFPLAVTVATAGVPRPSKGDPAAETEVNVTFPVAGQGVVLLLEVTVAVPPLVGSSKFVVSLVMRKAAQLLAALIT